MIRLWKKDHLQYFPVFNVSIALWKHASNSLCSFFPEANKQAFPFRRCIKNDSSAPHPSESNHIPIRASSKISPSKIVVHYEYARIGVSLFALSLPLGIRSVHSWVVVGEKWQRVRVREEEKRERHWVWVCPLKGGGTVISWTDERSD